MQWLSISKEKSDSLLSVDLDAKQASQILTLQRKYEKGKLLLEKQQVEHEKKIQFYFGMVIVLFIILLCLVLYFLLILFAFLLMSYVLLLLLQISFHYTFSNASFASCCNVFLICFLCSNFISEVLISPATD